jgi:hypothetical protein
MRPALLDRYFPASTVALRKILGCAGALEDDASQVQCFQTPDFSMMDPKLCLCSGCGAWKWDKARFGWRRILQWLLFRKRGHCHHAALR